MRKNLLFIWIPIATWIWIVLASCNNSSTGVEQLPKTGFKPPVTVPLIFSKPKKINWDAIKATRVKPLVKKFDMAKLPVQSYDSTGFKPFKYSVEETKIDYYSLPEKDFDIDKIPSKPLKFKTYILPPPKLIKSGLPRLKGASLSLYEFGEAQGLEGTVATCLLNDHEGFLWIATDKGIYRYDGESLLLYIPMAAGYIFNMLQDHAGRIWISVANQGLEIFDPIAGTLKKTNMDLGLSSNNPFGLIEDKQQRIWISANNGHAGINIIDPKMQTVKLLDTTQGLSNSVVAAGISQDKNNNVWIASLKGLNIIDLKNKKIKYLDKAHGLASDQVNNVLFDREGTIWIGLQDGLINILDLQNGTLQFIKEAKSPGSSMLSLMQDNKGRIWAATTTNGLEIIDPGKHLASHLQISDGLAGNFVANIKQDSRGQVWVATQTGLSMIADNNAVIEQIGKAETTTLIEDKDGLIWQASVYNGVNIIDRKTKTFKHLSTINGLVNDTMASVREINGQVFICATNGLDVIDSSRHKITLLGKKQGINNSLVSNVIIDRENKIWIGGQDNGIDVYDPRMNTIKHLGKAEGLIDNSILDIYLDRLGHVWASSGSGGVDVIDPMTGIVRSLENPPLKGINSSFLLDSTGNMWIGTSTGIYIADIKNRTLTSFSTPQGLLNESVNSLLKHDNHIYAGTSKGISVITPPASDVHGNKNWKVESFGTFYGLNKIDGGYATDLVTKDGLYWWGDEGINVLDLSKKKHFMPRLYIIGINILDEPKYFTGRGRAVSNGISWENVTGPNNMPVTLQLPYNQNYIQFNYANLNLANQDTTWYSYRLSGTDKNWSAETISTSSRNYFSMAPGKYTFEVISRSSYGNWGKPTTLSFTINPPWWQTWWAYALYVCLFAGSIWGFSHYRSLQLIKEKRILEHKVHIRTEEVLHQKEEIEAQRDDLDKAFRELKTTQNQLIQAEKMASLGELTAGIAHEIQNPLNFVNNFSEVSAELVDEMDDELGRGGIEEAKAIGADLKQNLEKIRHHGKRADAIVKGMLQHSQSGSGAKEPTNINSLAEEYLRLSYHGLRSKDKSFNAEMATHFDEKLPLINVIPQDIGRVMLNLFNNAFYAVNQKQRSAGADYKPEVSVIIALENGQVVIKVKDNGVGIPDAIKEKIMQPFFTTKPTGEGTGLGLSLTYDMVVKGHGGTIQVESIEGEGSEFIIQLPLN